MRVAVVGDSQLTNPWFTMRLCKWGYTVANFSVWGQSMYRCTVQPAAVNAVKPEIVLVALGTNDALQLKHPRYDFAEAYRRYLLELAAPVVCLGPPLNNIDWLADSMPDMQWWTWAVCDDIDKANYVHPPDLRRYMPDNVHPTEQGCLMLADFLQEKLPSPVSKAS